MRIAAARPDSAPDGDDGTYGPVRDPKVKLQISPNIENGAMSHINSIIVHQTGSATAKRALGS